MSVTITTQRVFRPTYLIESLGEAGRLPDGAIINAGGVAGATFTVGGKALLFADGSSTDGSPAGAQLNITLQSAYSNSSGLEAIIQAVAGKDIVLSSVSGRQLRFDADTGAVTITGDLTVLGSTTIVESTVETAEQLLIEPPAGVIPTVNLVEVRAAHGGPSVLQVGPDGRTFIQSLTVGGPINGVDLEALAARVAQHQDLSGTDVQHTARQVSVDAAGMSTVQGATVQEALQSVDAALSSLVATGVRAYEHVQESASDTWTIPHSGGTRRVQVSVWDSTEELVYADTVRIVDQDTVRVTFNTPITGRAILMLF